MNVSPQQPSPCCGPATTAVRGMTVESRVTPANAGAAPASLAKVDVPTAEAIDSARGGSTAGMVRLLGGAFLMGTDSADRWPSDGEGPVRQVALRPFWIDAAAVTTTAFSAFVRAAGYVTDAERFGWSFVFRGLLPKKYADTLHRTHAVPGLAWWLAVPGACWSRPEGERSNLRGRENHPVTHMSWNDAIAYCRWAGKRLPSEAEWEYAARGGLVQKQYPWGDELEPCGRHRCNLWQGRFPELNTAADCFLATCPVAAFEPNAYGLFNTSGNVWEWCGDWFSPTHHADARTDTRDNPRGPALGDRKVQKGGSFLCHRSYCNRYRLAARTSNTPDSSTCNLGFRCAADDG